MNILISNLEESLDYYIYETELSKITYGNKVEVIFPTTVPEILKSVNEMSSISSYNDITFIGINLTTLGIVSLTDYEFKSLLKEIFQENNIKSVVIKLQGLILRKEIGLGGIFMRS